MCGDTTAAGRDIRVDQPRDLAGGLDQAADREPRHRKIVPRQRDAGLRAVLVLAQHEVAAQARLGRRVALDRRHVARFLADRALVGRTEERDRVVVADDHDVLQRVRSVGIDDALDFLGHEVLRERARRVVRRLLLERAHPGIAGDVDDDAADFAARGERGELAAQRPAGGPGSAASSATFDESVRITVLRPDAGTAGRGVSTVSVTPAQVVRPLVTLSVNGLLVLKAPPRPVTRT